MSTLNDIVIASEILESGMEMSKGDEGRSGNVDSKKDGNVEGQGSGGNVDGNVFNVGDFVWGKIKNYPWWPGQVYDSKDASAFALKHGQEGRLLVVFFGDGSCSWCLPEQLVPFVENFKEMSVGGGSQLAFQNAVKCALDAVGRVVEDKMVCDCVPLDKREGLERQVVSITGIKAGVRVPEADYDRLSVPECEPEDILDKLSSFATNVNSGNLLEIAVLRSRVSAFNRSKGVCPMPVYKKTLRIEGLEEENKCTVTAVAGESVPVEKLSADEKAPERKKEKSVALLMQETEAVKSRGRKRSKAKEDAEVVNKFVSPPKRNKTTSDGNVEESGKGPSPSTRSGRKKKTAESESLGAATAEVASGEGKEEETVTSPRERKRSKYLSPPFTSPQSSRIGKSGIKMEIPDGVPKKDYLEVTPVSNPIDTTSKDKSVETNPQNVPVNDVPVKKKSEKKKLKRAAVETFRAKINEEDTEGKTNSPAPEKPQSSQATHDCVADARIMGRKLEMTTFILERYMSEFSAEDKSGLKDEVKHLMGEVDTFCGKVRVMAQNSAL